jgi:hypothetical protein
MDAIGFNRFHAGKSLATPKKVRFAEHPGAMTDGCDQLLRLEQIADETHHLFISPHLIRRIPARYNDPIEPRGPHLIDPGIALQGIPMLLV